MKAILIALALIGCDESDYKAASYEADREYLWRDLVYYHDKNTGLCFAGANLRFENSILTHVPCTEAVLARCSFIGTFPGPR